MEPQVRQERTGWRDQGLSLRHREWGWDCPAIDIDFLMVEYDLGNPVALVEYKNEHACEQRISHPSYRALIQLADRAQLPLFLVRYTDDFSQWTVIPLNDHAKEKCPSNWECSESDYVRFLYGLRGRPKYELGTGRGEDQHDENVEIIL